MKPGATSDPCRYTAPGLALTPGTRLGSYEVVTLIGSGGMGEVYRARDTRLGRDVAVKILASDVAADAERLARFEREAQILASLNHPNIAHIHGIAESPAGPGLVMELVEGPTLADHIERGAIPVDEAIAIAVQIAEALEAAHEQGIVHRDLKPANVKVRVDGTVKVLDFGLAKALDPLSSASGSNASMSPTLSIHATQAGLILGTAAYMAPEQVRGAAVDKRADVWAFGVVLYEMLSGRRLFDGGTISDTLAGVLRESIDLNALPASTTPSLRQLLSRCLERDPKRRLRDIGEARIQLQQPAPQSETLVAPAAPKAWRTATFALAIVALLLAIALVAFITSRPSAQKSPTYRFSFTLPQDRPVYVGGGAGMVTSPDGHWFVYATAGGLLKRAMDGVDFEPVNGAFGDAAGRAPFFSPDSQWLAFSADEQLKKVPVRGGIATTICRPAGGVRATWGDDGTIVYAATGKLFRVSSDGGMPQPISPGGAATNWSDPVFLPESRVVLATSASTPETPPRVEAIRLDTGVRTAVVDGIAARFVPPDRLLFEQQGTIWTARLDLKRLALADPPVPIADRVRVGGVYAYVTASPTVLAYASSPVADAATLVWVDREGNTSPVLSNPGGFIHPRVSPDGGRVVVAESLTNATDLWVYDLHRGTRLRLTTGGFNRRPVWSADGMRVAFQSDAARAGLAQLAGGHIYTIAADGSGKPELLINRPSAQFPDSWSGDGRLLFFNEGSNRRDVWVHTFGGDDKLLVKTRFSQRSAMVSPDGRWFAFVSNETGRDEVYVQRVDSGTKIPVSTSGGRQPAWSRNGRELFYRADDWMMAVNMTTPEKPGAPQKLFEFPRRAYGDDPNVVEYDVAADGRFLAARHDVTPSDEIRVIVNWR